MSMTRELIEKLEEMEEWAGLTDAPGAKVIRDAIDAIRALSAALHVANMERSSQYYNGGWIPVDEERFPEPGEYVLLSFSNFSLPAIGRYEEDEEGGAFYEGDSDETLASFGLFVNAWMPLPEPYRGEEEESPGGSGAGDGEH